MTYDPYRKEHGVNPIDPVGAIADPHDTEVVLANPSVAWHALHGFDFAGMESMLRLGLEPNPNQGENVICLSASPSVSHGINREANSFYAYSLQGGISLGIDLPSPLYPYQVHGGFMDEVRVLDVSPDQITKVLIDTQTAQKPIVDLTYRRENRRPHVMMAYIERTAAHIEALGGVISEEHREIIRDVYVTAQTGQRADQAAEQRVNSIFMEAYSRILEARIHHRPPTVQDMIDLIMERTGKTVTLCTYSEDQKRAIGTKNAQIAVQNQSSRGGGSGIMDHESFSDRPSLFRNRGGLWPGGVTRQLH